MAIPAERLAEAIGLSPEAVVDSLYKWEDYQTGIGIWESVNGPILHALEVWDEAAQYASVEYLLPPQPHSGTDLIIRLAS